MNTSNSIFIGVRCRVGVKMNAGGAVVAAVEDRIQPAAAAIRGADGTDGVREVRTNANYSTCAFHKWLNDNMIV